MTNIRQENIDKIKLFWRVFGGRRDILAKRWESSGRSGYSPICENEWKEDVCRKPCRDCKNFSYTPVSIRLLYSHLMGETALGVYPLLPDNTCNFIAADFDKHSDQYDPIDEVVALVEVCKSHDISCYTLKSRSGKGYHSYVFFEPDVLAWKARAIMYVMLRKAGVVEGEKRPSGFDRLFPNQDEISLGRLGNLIALPFQGKAALQKNTLFLDPTTRFSRPFDDQFSTLQSIIKVDVSKLDLLIDDFDIEKITANSMYNCNTSVKIVTKC